MWGISSDVWLFSSDAETASHQKSASSAVAVAVVAGARQSRGGRVVGGRWGLKFDNVLGETKCRRTQLMNAEEYANLERMEREHWYYAGKRQLVREWLERAAPPRPSDTLLDCGAGTGL